MGLISELLHFVGFDSLGDAADTLNVEGSALKDMATDYAKDKATDFAKDKAKGYVAKKVFGSGKKSKYEEPDKSDKYWYLKDE